MRIAVSGAGYVGLSSAMLLSQNHEVVLLDVYRARDPESLQADVRELIPELKQRNLSRNLTYFSDTNSIIF